MAKIFVNLLGVLLLLRGGNAIVEVEDEVISADFYSRESAYKKIVFDTGRDFTSASEMCSNRGLGWRDVEINSEAEYELIRRKEMELYDHRPFWVGGSTDEDEDTLISLSEYYPNNTGERRVFLSNFDIGSCSYDLQLPPRAGSTRLNGILCETYDLSYESESSWYQKLVYDGDYRNKDFWTAQCLEMGEGWAPAIINSEDELEFIRTQQLGFSSLRDYSVGGSTYSTSYDISYEEYRTDSEGPYNVFVQTYGYDGRSRWRNENFKLAHADDEVQLLFGILCERAKP